MIEWHYGRAREAEIRREVARHASLQVVVVPTPKRRDVREV